MSLASPWAQASAEMLARLGHEIHAIDFDEVKGSYFNTTQEDIARIRKNVAGVHLLSGFPPSNLRYFQAVPQFRSVLRKIRPDVLLTLYAGGFAQLAWFSRFRPYAVFAVGSDVLLVSGIRRAISRWTLKGAAEVFANGDYLAQKTREIAPRAKVTSLLLGVDTERFSPAPRGDGPLQLICNRGFKDLYNNESIIHALAALKVVPPFQFHFTSPGPTLPRARELAARILPPHIRERVFFWGGVSTEKMLELLRSSQIFVSMSRSDGTATSLLEALSCGLFPILSDIPQNCSWINDSVKNGFLAPLDDIQVLAMKIHDAIFDPAIIESARAFNRAVAVKKADSRLNLQRLADSLKAIATPAPPP